MVEKVAPIPTSSLGETIPLDGSKFRLANQRIFLTYTHIHFDKQEYIEWFKSIMTKKSMPAFIRCAQETGLKSPECPHEHMHVLIDFGSKFQTTNCRFFDYQGVHPNLKRLLSKEHWRHELRYIAKEDKENEDCIKMAGPVQHIWSFDTLSGALADVDQLRDVLPTIAAYESRPNLIVHRPEPRWVPWNSELVAEISKPIDQDDIDSPAGYKVIWIYDKPGTSGKTRTMQYLTATWPKRYFSMTNVSGPDNVAEYVKGCLGSGWNGHCVIINCAKSRVDYKNLYTTIECIKDGSLSTYKWHGAPLDFPRPHVVVLSNEIPDVHQLSPLRWDVREIIDRRIFLRLSYDDCINRRNLVLASKGIARPLRDAPGTSITTTTAYGDLVSEFARSDLH
nr:MAG: replication associated protein [Cressdnaviricota sp.]